MNSRNALVGLALALILGGPFALAEEPQPAAPANPSREDTPGKNAQRGITFYDARRQSEVFLRFNQTIRLTPEQEAIKREALSELRAPCCSDKTAYTCCCPCNMAKTWWGLSNYLIAKRGFTAGEVRATVADWFRFINPDGFSGDACYSGGGCSRPFEKNGCGGMRASQVTWN